jgi:hypothetical protein
VSGVLAAQCASGAFPSEVEGLRDETCFVTAAVALLLHRSRHAAALARALDFVESCECPEQPGAFAFYPPAGATPRLVEGLPPDADDTALAWLALLHGGRRDAASARDAFRRVIAPAARRMVSGTMPAWVRPHAVLTWLADGGSDNPVDLAVNANVVALAHRIELQDHPACEGASASLLAAAQGRYEPRAFARRLAPYYADISELWFCVRRAVACGAGRLAPALSWLAPVFGADAFRPDKPLYCNAHGMPIWRSPALQEVRRAFDPDFPSGPFSTSPPSRETRLL